MISQGEQAGLISSSAEPRLGSGSGPGVTQEAKDEHQDQHQKEQAKEIANQIGDVIFWGAAKGVVCQH